MIRAAARAAMAAAMVERVEELGGVVYRWPVSINPAPIRVTLVVRDLDGQIEVPTYGDGDDLRASDTWEIDVIARADASLQTTADAEQLAEDLADAALGAMHADSALGGLNRSAGTAGTWRLGEVVAVRFRGPEVLDLGDGPAGVAIVTFRLTAAVFR